MIKIVKDKNGKAVGFAIIKKNPDPKAKKHNLLKVFGGAMAKKRAASATCKK